MLFRSAKRSPAEELASSLTKETRRPLGRRGVGSVAPLPAGPRRPNKSRRRKGANEKGGTGTGEGKRANQGSGGATREQEEKAAHPRPQPVVDIVDSSSPCKMFYIYVQQKRVSCARKCRRCEFFFWNEKNQRIQQQIQSEICFVCLQIFPL